jgi:hypothetical protein
MKRNRRKKTSSHPYSSTISCHRPIKQAVTAESAGAMLFRSEKRLGKFREDQWLVDLA